MSKRSNNEVQLETQVRNAQLAIQERYEELIFADMGNYGEVLERCQDAGAGHALWNHVEAMNTLAVLFGRFIFHLDGDTIRHLYFRFITASESRTGKGLTQGQWHQIQKGLLLQANEFFGSDANFANDRKYHENPINAQHVNTMMRAMSEAETEITYRSPELASALSSFSNSGTIGGTEGLFSDWCKLFDDVILAVTFASVENIPEITNNRMGASVYTTIKFLAQILSSNGASSGALPRFVLNISLPPFKTLRKKWTSPPFPASRIINQMFGSWKRWISNPQMDRMVGHHISYWTRGEAKAWEAKETKRNEDAVASNDDEGDEIQVGEESDEDEEATAMSILGRFGDELQIEYKELPHALRPFAKGIQDQVEVESILIELAMAVFDNATLCPARVSALAARKAVEFAKFRLDSIKLLYEYTHGSQPVDKKRRVSGVGVSGAAGVDDNAQDFQRMHEVKTLYFNIPDGEEDPVASSLLMRLPQYKKKKNLGGGKGALMGDIKMLVQNHIVAKTDQPGIRSKKTYLLNRRDLTSLTPSEKQAATAFLSKLGVKVADQQ